MSGYMLRMLRLLFVTLAVLTASGTVAAFPAPAPQGWEQVNAADVTDNSEQKLTVTARNGYVYIAVRETATVKVVTILGQPITMATLTPGTWRFRIKMRGIYIVKTDGQTRRVTV